MRSRANRSRKPNKKHLSTRKTRRAKSKKYARKHKSLVKKGGFMAAIKGAVTSAAPNVLMTAAKNKATAAKEQAMSKVKDIKTAATDQTKAVKAALCKRVCGCSGAKSSASVTKQPSVASSLDKPIVKSPTSNKASAASVINKLRSPPNVTSGIASLKANVKSPGNTIKRNLFTSKTPKQRRVDPDRKGVIKGARDDLIDSIFS